MTNEHPSLILRIAIGKGVGFVVGLIGFGLMPYMVSVVDPMLPWGILLWYTTMGAIIGMFGVFTYHPVLHLPLPWWARSSMLGAWMNFVLVFFAYDQMRAVLMQMFGAGSNLTSPFWFVAEGAVIGLLMGFCATRFGGEGPLTLTRDEIGDAL